MKNVFLKNTVIRVVVLMAIACQSTHQREDKKGGDEQSAVLNATANIPEYRDELNSDAVAEYKERTDNPLNEWYFRVQLFETPKTFYYLIKLQFEEIRGTDTLKLPNFGLYPKPVIQKGKEKYSCIIGFLDKENEFREYKKVYVKDNRLKITALKHYAVYTYQKEK